MPDACHIPDLVLDWILSFSPLLPGCALRRISIVCVKVDDDLIKASREVHQSVIEAYTEILSLQLLVPLSFSGQGPCHLPLQSSDGDQGDLHQSLWGVHLTVDMLLLFIVLLTSQVH